MSKWAHWSARYALDRLCLSLFQATHPGAPWLTPGAIAYLDAWLKPHHVGVEYGSGRSTPWIARRVGHLTSVEHSQEWYEKVVATLKRRSVANTRLVLRDARSDDYMSPIMEIDDQSLDFAFVDGVSDRRDACALALIRKLRPGGILLIDDSHRYFSYETRSPLALGPGRASLTETWRQVMDATHEWKCTLTTSGVTDTLILHRPESR